VFRHESGDIAILQRRRGLLYAEWITGAVAGLWSVWGLWSVCMRGYRPQGRRNATFVDSRPRSRDPRHFSDAETVITVMRTRRTRWVLASLAVVALGLGLAGPVAARGRIAPVTGVVITGHGYGPGVGMSQWGAEERASAGETHEQILSFYYPGTEIGTAPSATMRVLLAERPRLTVGSRAAFRLVQANGASDLLAAGHEIVTAAGLAGRRLTFPIRLMPKDAPLMLGGNAYRGTFEVILAGSKLELVNSLPLEQYVADVVSVENPAYWPQEALRAQAIASRSYALASVRASAAFDVYSDNRSQNYRGLRKESTSAEAAASSTRGQVLLYDGAIVPAFFTAANGGMTSNTDDVWQGQPVPYLTSRPDPFDARSPDSNWGPVGVTMSMLRQKFPNLPSTVVQIDVVRNSGDRITSISFVGDNGVSYSVDGATFQQRLDLRSTYATLTAAYGG
jgi:stage II sporulation protein D